MPCLLHLYLSRGTFAQKSVEGMMKDSKPCNPMMFIVTWICFFWVMFLLFYHGIHHHFSPPFGSKFVLETCSFPHRRTIRKHIQGFWVSNPVGSFFLVLIFSRWWFQICSIFNPIWGRFPFWLIFFRWVETMLLEPYPALEWNPSCSHYFARECWSSRLGSHDAGKVTFYLKDVLGRILKHTSS